MRILSEDEYEALEKVDALLDKKLDEPETTQTFAWQNALKYEWGRVKAARAAAPR